MTGLEFTLLCAVAGLVAGALTMATDKNPSPAQRAIGPEVVAIAVFLLVAVVLVALLALLGGGA